VQAPKQLMQEPTLQNRGEGRSRWMVRANGSIGLAGVLAMACMQGGPDATREAPAVIRSWDQPATRESQAGPFGVTVRFVVPMKPGNAGGGKEP